MFVIVELIWFTRRFGAKHAIPLVIERDRVVDGTFEVNDRNLREKLPYLQLQEKDDKPILAAGGQHRVEAMSIWMENMTNQFNVVEDKMKEIANLNWDDDHEGEIDEYNKQLKPQLERLGRHMAYGGQWMVLLFDKGTSNISVIVLICANISESTLRDSGSSSIAQYRVQ